jgi:hypothetical protein
LNPFFAGVLAKDPMVNTDAVDAEGAVVFHRNLSARRNLNQSLNCEFFERALFFTPSSGRGQLH